MKDFRRKKKCCKNQWYDCSSLLYICTYVHASPGKYITCEEAGKMDAFWTWLAMATAIITVEYECNDDSVFLAMNIVTTRTAVHHTQVEGQCWLFIDV